MVTIKGFKALRPKVEFVKDTASLPYDVVNSEEAREIVKKNPKSFMTVERGEVNLAKGIDIYSNEVYNASKESLNRLINEGIYIEEEKESLYIYRQISDKFTQTGLVSCSSVDDYLNNIVKKHEKVRGEKLEDRVRHIDECNAQTGIIFLVYKKNIELENIIKEYTNSKPIYNFISDDNITHMIWKIDDEVISNKIIKLFKEMNSVYIADGHHRTEGASRVALKRRGTSYVRKKVESDYFLSIAYSENDIRILDYNRKVFGLNGLSEKSFIEKVKENFKVTVSYNNEAIKPKKKHVFGMCLNGKWYKLEANECLYKDKSNIDSLDVSVLQDNLLSSVLGIEDATKSKKIKFIGGLDTIKELEKVDINNDVVSFSLYPVSMEEIINIADEGQIMPPKSTWFDPKPRVGILIHKI